MNRRTFVLMIASAIATFKAGKVSAAPVEIRSDRIKAATVVVEGKKYLELPWNLLKFVAMETETGNPNILDIKFFTYGETLQDRLHHYIYNGCADDGVRMLVTGSQFGEGVLARCIEIRTMKWNPYLSADEVRPTIFHLRLDYEGEMQ